MTTGNQSEKENIVKDKSQSLQKFDALKRGVEDDFIKLIASICNAPIAFISQFSKKEFNIISSFGLTDEILNHENSLIKLTSLVKEPILEIKNLNEDEHKNSKLSGLNLIFYAGIPILNSEGTTTGTISIIDKKPRTLTKFQKESIFTLAKQAGITYNFQNEILKSEGTGKSSVKKENHFQAIIEAVDDMIFELDDKGYFIYVNPATVRETCYSEKELFNMHYLEILDNADLGEVLDFYKAQLQSGHSTSYLEVSITPKGKTEKIHIGLKLEFIFDGKKAKKIYVIARDITELVKARIQLADNEEKYRVLSENSRDLISLYIPNGTYKFISNSSKDLLGYEPEEMMNIDPYSLYHPDDRERVIKHVKKEIINQKGTAVEFRIRKKDGSYTWFESYNTPIYGNSRNVVIIQSTSRDISKRKEQEFNLMKADERINQHKEGFKRLNEIASNNHLSAEQQIYEALWVSAEFLGMDTGILSKIEDEKYVIDNFYGDEDHFKKGLILELSDTFCEMSHRKEEVFAIDNVSTTTLKVHTAHTISKVENYIGIPYYVSGKKRGTIAFISTDIREDKFDINEFEFIKLLSRWIGFIIQHQEHEKDLIADKMILQAFVSSAPAAIAMFDPEIKYIAASDKWYSEYNLEDEYIIGKTYFEVFPEVGSEWKQVFESALKGNIESNDQDLIERSNGDIRWIKWEVRPWFRKLDTVGGLIMYTEDISQQKEQQLQLKIAKRKAEQASKAKEQFLSTMSHEIRTPLNAIIGMTDLMLMEDQDDEQLKRLNLLKFSGSKLLVLINDILDFNKIEAGKLEFEIVDFNLRNLLDKTRESLLNLTDKKGLDFNLFYDSDIPLYVKGDSLRIGQVITNLVNNAIKFTEDGYISLKSRLIHKEEEQCIIKFEIKDTGIGISQDKLETIFQTFEQGSLDITRKYGGSGLGLAITKKILSLMNSKIQVHSAEGLGSVFFFELSLPIGKPPEILTDKRIVDSAVRDDIRLLVAEDNEGNRILIDSLFRKWEIDFDFALDGSEAVEMVQSKKYNMIFMDLQMPVMDGFEATKAIRGMKDEYFVKIPIVALTASVMTNVLEKVKDVGMNDYVSKPFDPTHLKNTIRNYTNGSEELLQVTEIITEKSDEFPYLKSLIGDDEESLWEIVKTSIESVTNACNGIEEGLSASDQQRIRSELHVLRPNLHNLEMGELVSDLPKFTQLDDNIINSLKKLLIEINNELNSKRFKKFKP